MSGLDDLRRSLEAHAGDVPAADPTVRRTAVHQRIRVARRRRAGGAVVAVAAVVALVAGIALLPGSTDKEALPDPADTVTVFGVEVPQTMTSLGFTYELVDTIDLGTEASFTLEASDTARLVSWGTQGDDQLVDVNNIGAIDDLGGSTSYAEDFTDFTLVGAGSERTISFVSSETVAVATYEVTDERPEGVTVDGITFRDTVGGARLIDASIGDLGQSSVSVPLSSAQGDVQARVFCTGGEARTKTAIIPVVLGSEPDLGCVGGVPLDAAQRPAIDVTGDPEVVLEARSPNGATFESPDLRVGLAIYEAAETTDGLPNVLETDGHRWRLADSGPIGTGVAVPLGAARRLVVVQVPRPVGLIRVNLGGSYVDSVSMGGDRLATELPADVSTVDVSVGGGPTGREGAVVGFYELDD